MNVAHSKETSVFLDKADSNVLSHTEEKKFKSILDLLSLDEEGDLEIEKKSDLDIEERYPLFDIPIIPLNPEKEDSIASLYGDESDYHFNVKNENKDYALDSALLSLQSFEDDVYQGNIPSVQSIYDNHAVITPAINEKLKNVAIEKHDLIDHVSVDKINASFVKEVCLYNNKCGEVINSLNNSKIIVNFVTNKPFNAVVDNSSSDDIHFRIFPSLEEQIDVTCKFSAMPKDGNEIIITSNNQNNINAIAENINELHDTLKSFGLDNLEFNLNYSNENPFKHNKKNAVYINGENAKKEIFYTSFDRLNIIV